MNTLGVRADERGNRYVGDVPFVGIVYAKIYDFVMKSSTADRPEFNQYSVEGLETQKEYREYRRILLELVTLDVTWRKHLCEKMTNGGSKKKTRKISKKERGRKPKKTIKSLKPKKTIKSIKLKKSKKSRKPKKH